MEYKQFIIIPKKPSMSTGKIASQAAHASFMALERQRELISASEEIGFCFWDNIDKWKLEGQCIIVLECKDQAQLLSASMYLDQWKIPNHLYIDEGLTEVDSLTPTALATGILPKEYWWMLRQFKKFK